MTTYKHKIYNAAEVLALPPQHEIVTLIKTATLALKARNLDSVIWRIELATEKLEAKNAAHRAREASK